MKKSSIGITETKGDILGAGFRGNENVIAKDVQGNITVLNINSLSYEVLEKIIKTPTQVDVSPLVNTTNEDNRDIKKMQEGVASTQQICQVLDEMDKIDEEKGTEVQEIKTGDLQISIKELLLKRAIL